MSKYTHTPGPWIVNAEQIFGGAYLIAEVNENCPDWQENRDLIAAAPELLEVLKFAEDYLRHDAPTARKAVRAAIAKAEGVLTKIIS